MPATEPGQVCTCTYLSLPEDLTSAFYANGPALSGVAPRARTGLSPLWRAIQKHNAMWAPVFTSEHCAKRQQQHAKSKGKCTVSNVGVIHRAGGQEAGPGRLGPRWWAAPDGPRTVSARLPLPSASVFAASPSPLQESKTEPAVHPPATAPAAASCKALTQWRSQCPQTFSPGRVVLSLRPWTLSGKALLNL